MITARPRQQNALQMIRAAFARGFRRVLACAPTGFGKTILIALIVFGHLRLVEGGRVLVVVHRRELIPQTVGKLHLAGVTDVAVVGTPEAASAPVLVGTVQTLLALPALPGGITLLILDEAHHYAAAEWSRIASHYRTAFIVGVTATPTRSDGTGLDDLFEEMVICATVRELMAEGLLVGVDVLAPAGSTSALAQDPVAAYEAYAAGTAAVVFAANVPHARELADRFRARGHRAACIDGETESAERDEAIARFGRGELDVLTNVHCLTEGWDAPRAQTCILARAPSNVGTYLQMVGRVLRVAPGKTRATVIDLCGAVYTVGLPDEDRTWTLDGRAVRTEKIAALRHCPECFAICRPVSRCPRCGAEMTTAPKLPRTLNRAEVLERVSDLPPAARDARYLASLERIARTRMRMPEGRAREWARAQFERRFGRRTAA